MWNGWRPSLPNSAHLTCWCSIRRMRSCRPHREAPWWRVSPAWKPSFSATVLLCPTAGSSSRRRNPYSARGSCSTSSTGRPEPSSRRLNGPSAHPRRPARLDGGYSPRPAGRRVCGALGLRRPSMGRPSQVARTARRQSTRSRAHLCRPRQSGFFAPGSPQASRCRLRLRHRFSGPLQSAIVTRVARRAAAYGFHRSLVREWPAALFYTHALRTAEPHVVGRNLALAVAAGATPGPAEFPLPQGRPEGQLPARFVLAAPLAGWRSKQWPLEYYAPLARRLREQFDLALVLNGPPSSEPILRTVEGAHVHISGVSGLIDATRRATAVLGLDSGPMHLAAALRTPGVALFGPTDPARNGPYGNSLTVLRAASAGTTYTRGSFPDPSLRALKPEFVFAALSEVLRNAQSTSQPGGCGSCANASAGDPIS